MVSPLLFARNSLTASVPKTIGTITRGGRTPRRCNAPAPTAGSALPTGRARKTVGPAGPHRRLRSRDRELLAVATREGRIVASQAWRWFFAQAASIKPARNRLGELAAAGLLVRVPMRQGQEGVYVPTREGARLSRTGLTAPPVPGAKDARGLGTLGHDLTVAEVGRWLPGRAGAAPGTRWLAKRELARERILARPPTARRGGAGLGYLPDGALVTRSGERLAVEVELHDKAERLGRKLDWYLHRAGYAGVLWLTHKDSIRRRLQAAIRRAGARGQFMWVELLPADVRLHID